MSKNGILVLIQVAALLVAVLLGAGLLLNPIETGRQPLELRAGVAALAGLLLVVGVRPFTPWGTRAPLIFILLLGIPGLVAGPWYYFGYLPARAGNGVSGEQLASSMITESTSNGIVEVGFAYPIYTPTVRLQNNELFTRDVDVYLRVLDGNNEPNLFRAVRAQLPDSRLSVEASVHGLLSDSPGYLLIPIAIPPLGAVEGRVVFIISDLNDGSTFTEALGRSYPAEFQLRDPDSGELLMDFPMSYN
ncbi:MAG: hypothetical protein R3F50_14225 [Gammaproteobacteria bacterium]|jgi:hypothetical protein